MRWWWIPDKTASDTVVSREMYGKSECIPTVVPKLAVAPLKSLESRVTRDGYSGCCGVRNDISGGPDVLQTAVSVTTVVSEKWMEIDTPDAVVSGTEVAGGSPPADIDISGGPDVLQTAVW